MGKTPVSQDTSGIRASLEAICKGRSDIVAFPDDYFYQSEWVRPYNLDVHVEPVAVVRPRTAQDVSDFVKCALKHNVQVQARGGGHSYGNHGMGGQDGALGLDMRYMKKFEMDTKTWQAKIGPGWKLGNLDEQLVAHGNRAIAHGICPGVGIAGHATIGGLGPSSRMWGSCLDHVLEVEVVIADGSIVRANKDKNPDLFWAIKGAGASFGIVTEFVMRTQAAPGKVVSYTTKLSFAKHRDLAAVYKQWQDLVTDPGLDRRFSTEFTMFQLGVVVSATFFGTPEEYEATGIRARLPASDDSSVSIDTHDWLGALSKHAQTSALWLGDIPTNFVSKSRGYRRDNVLDDATIARMMSYLDDAHHGTPIWFLIFSSTGGAVADVPTHQTAYAHRDKIMFAETYGIGIPHLRQTTRDFVDGLIDTIEPAAGDTYDAIYPGYVDVTLQNPQQAYWGPNLARLQAIKAKWDPREVFHNPQSVRPDAAIAAANIAAAAASIAAVATAAAGAAGTSTMRAGSQARSGSSATRNRLRKPRPVEGKRFKRWLGWWQRKVFRL